MVEGKTVDVTLADNKSVMNFIAGNLLVKEDDGC